MDILLQFLNVRKQRQVFVKVTDLGCNSIYQAINRESMNDQAVAFIDYLDTSFGSPFLFTGILDAQYCSRQTIAELSYTDFRRITCGPGEASGID